MEKDWIVWEATTAKRLSCSIFRTLVSNSKGQSDENLN